jgi:hypothetical protein
LLEYTISETNSDGMIEDILEDDEEYVINNFEYIVTRCTRTFVEIFIEVFEPVLGFFYRFSQRY